MPSIGLKNIKQPSKEEDISQVIYQCNMRSMKYIAVTLRYLTCFWTFKQVPSQLNMLGESLFHVAAKTKFTETTYEVMRILSEKSVKSNIKDS